MEEDGDGVGLKLSQWSKDTNRFVKLIVQKGKLSFSLFYFCNNTLSTQAKELTKNR